MKSDETVQFEKTREDLLEFVQKDLLGPQAPEEELDGLPHRNYYIAGILYPREFELDEIEAAEDEMKDKAVNNDISEAAVAQIYSLANSYMPSSMGVSCLIDLEKAVSIQWNVVYATYSKEREEEKGKKQNEEKQEQAESDKKRLWGKKMWKRKEHSQSGVVELRDLKKSGRQKVKIGGGLSLISVFYPGEARITASLINDNKIEKKDEGTKVDQAKIAENSFFQVELSLSSPDRQKIFLPRSLGDTTNKEEELEYELLYRDKRTFAVGHGCAASWSGVDANRAEVIKTDCLPIAEVPTVDFCDSRIKGSPNILDMEFLADEDGRKKDEIIAGLENMNLQYANWINEREEESKTIESELLPSAKENLIKCREACGRIGVGVEILQKNPAAWRAFALANKAIADQQKTLQKKWRPFQLAFILLNIKGLTDAESNDRKLVDLIWFPTGGGKTEAYLGITAFVIFYRRLQDKVSGAGTAAIMRYTLRLLTTQQLQRAAKMICACESLRSTRAQALGKERISIGLWVGSEVTPNNAKEYARKLEEDKFSSILTHCPKCEAELIYAKKKPRVRCSNSECIFAVELPFLFIDDDIYDDPPSLIISTVDKFAAMSMVFVTKGKDIAPIFAADYGNKKLPPSLIIQDELHLITGPLGTMVGLFELAVQSICSRKGSTPKILAATATIRGSKEQCENLFGRKVVQFPPAGTEISDNFFSREVPTSEKPGRFYIGVQAAGHTLTTTEIRVGAALLQGAYKLLEDYKVKGESQADERYKNAEKYLDPYWTLVAYFSSIRELGKFHSHIPQDIANQMLALSTREKRRYRRISDQKILEMTGTRKSKEIPELLSQMELGLPHPGCPDVVLTTNMFSVGVDISRLGLMLIANQPKSNAEYIQASSRIGRKYPGLIFVLYDFSRSRDKSYYENFMEYHSCFYRYVESSSLTPFSPPALERGLQSVIVALARNKFRDEGVIEFSDFRKHPKILIEIKEIIMTRIKAIASSEVEHAEKILDIHLQDLKTYLSTRAEPKWSEFLVGMQTEPASGLGQSQWTVLSSMRNVDSASTIDFLRCAGAGLKKDEEPNSFERDEMRTGQLIVPFGPGAIVDLPKNKIGIVLKWHNSGKKIIKSPDSRFLSRLKGRCFITPPTEKDGNVPVLQLPEWGYCPRCRMFTKIGPGDFKFNARRGMYCHQHDEDKRSWPVFPIRFIAVCERGHIDDVPWDVMVHQDNPDYVNDGKVHTMTYKSSGVSGGLADDTIRCSCEKSLRFSDLFSKRFPCTGRTHLEISDPKQKKQCSRQMRVQHQGAASVYFPIIRSSIYLPDQNAEKATEIITSLLNLFSTEEDAEKEKEFIADKIAKELGLPKAAAWDLFKKSFAPADAMELTDADQELAYRKTEYMLFSSPTFQIDFTKNLSLKRDPNYTTGGYPAGIKDIVLVSSLKETRALLGFTRIFPSGGGNDQSEETAAGVSGVEPIYLVQDKRVPAVEVRGEGIFLKFDEVFFEKWGTQKEVVDRASGLIALNRKKRKNFFTALREITPEFILLHTLSHVLIRQLSLECGYSAPSLKERLYFEKSEGKVKMCGILIYTASGDSEGTLGGLVRQGKLDRFPVFFNKAVEGARWCSADPLCIESGGQGREALNLGACHACALLPETSCECQNVYLDRRLLNMAFKKS